MGLLGRLFFFLVKKRLAHMEETINPLPFPPPSFIPPQKEETISEAGAITLRP